MENHRGERKARSLASALLNTGVSLLAVAVATSLAPTALAAPGEGVVLQVKVEGRTASRIERSSVANETFTARPGETLEVLLSDGSSLLLASGASLTIEIYQFDPATGSGTLSVRLTSGAVRVMGGRLNARTPIRVALPGGVADLSDGSAFFEAGPLSRFTLLIAGQMTVTQNGGTQSLERSGYEVTADGRGALSEPMRQSREAAIADSTRINPLLAGALRAPEVAVNASDEVRVDDNRTDAPQAPDYSRGLIQFADGSTVGVGGSGFGALVGGITSGPGDNAADRGIVQNRTLADAVRSPGQTTNRISNVASRAGYSLTCPGGVCSTGQMLSGTSADLIYASTLGLLSGKLTFGNFSFVPYDFLLRSGSEEEKHSLAGFLAILPRSQCSETSVDPKFCGGLPLFSPGAGLGFFRDYLMVAPVQVLDRSGRPADWWFNSAAQNRVLTVSARNEVNFGLFENAAVNNGVGNTEPTAEEVSYRLLQAGFSSPDPRANFLVYDWPIDAAGVATDDQGVRYLVKSDGSTLFAADGTRYELQETFDGVSLLGGSPAPTIVIRGSQSRAADNFLMVEAELGGVLRTFATGDVSNQVVRDRSARGSTVQRFALSQGLNLADLVQGVSDLDINSSNNALTDSWTFAAGPVSRSFRAFAPAALTSTLTSTDLYIANAPATQMSSARNSVYHLDFGVSPNGRASTVGATLGRVTYTETDDNRSNVAVSGTTIATMRGAPNNPNTSYLYVSPLAASAVGGGGDWSGTGVMEGYASYFVLENVIQPAPGLTSATGGTVTEAGTQGAQTERFGFLRLAAGINSAADPDSTVQSYTGYVRGIAERSATAGGTTGSFFDGTLTEFTVNGADNTARAAVTIDGVQTRLDLEGAYIDRSKYGAASASAAIASGASVADALKQLTSIGLVSGGQAATGAALVERMKNYQHVQWGFLFGDVGNGATARHINLATWAGGAPTTLSRTSANLPGAAKYEGHMLGNVVNNGQSYLGLGSFIQTWNLQKGSGSMSMTFDGADYATSLSMSAAGWGYAGRAGAGTSTGDRIIDIKGAMYGASGNAPGGSAGAFEVTSANGTYTAVGTFAGDRVQ